MCIRDRCWITKAIIRLAGRRSHPLSKRLTVRGTRYEWVKKAEVNSGKRAGVPTELADRLKALERKNRELRQANEDPAQGVGIFYPRGARLPVQAMTAFIDEHRDAYGVEPICRVLPIVPSTYHERVAQRRDPRRLCLRVQRDDALKPEVRCVFDGNFSGNPGRFRL